jgi:translation initiation factor 2B subunit (eIF-2B alpha/beta/delta family)
MPAEVEVAERKTAVIDATLIRDAKLIATHEGGTIAEVLERHLRPGIARDLKRVVAELAGN